MRAHPGAKGSDGRGRERVSRGLGEGGGGSDGGLGGGEEGAAGGRGDGTAALLAESGEHLKAGGGGGKGKGNEGCGAPSQQSIFGPEIAAVSSRSPLSVNLAPLDLERLSVYQVDNCEELVDAS